MTKTEPAVVQHEGKTEMAANPPKPVQGLTNPTEVDKDAIGEKSKAPASNKKVETKAEVAEYKAPELLPNDTPEVSAFKMKLAIANHLFKAGCFSKDVQNAAQAFVKIQAGAEMGMEPMESMNSLYIVNGHVSIWGMALSRRLRSNGWRIEYNDPDLSKCEVKIKKGDEEYSYFVTSEDMKKMNSKAYGFAPKEKMRWHCLGRLVRFYVPEILGGSTVYLAEEAEDIRGDENTIEAGKDRKAALRKKSND